jgi:hypothetical protein
VVPDKLQKVENIHFTWCGYIGSRARCYVNVLALENILVALTRKIGDGPCFFYIKFSWIGVDMMLVFDA